MVKLLDEAFKTKASPNFVDWKGEELVWQATTSLAGGLRGKAVWLALDDDNAVSQQAVMSAMPIHPDRLSEPRLASPLLTVHNSCPRCSTIGLLCRRVAVAAT